MTAASESTRSTTPRAPVHGEGSLRLYRYESLAPRRAAPPVVLVYSLINKPSICDLVPSRSLVRSLLEAGLDVFLVDWGEPGVLESTLDLGGHLERLERAVRAASRLATSEKASLLGYCLGGTFSLMLAAQAPELVERVGLLATPVVFSQGGTLALWAKASGIDPARMAVSPDGNVPGPLLRELLRWLDPVGQVKKWLLVGERALDRDFMDLFLAQEEWANGAVAFPGRLYGELVETLYREDALARGTLVARGRPLRLDSISARVLNVLSKEDRIVPEGATRPLASLVGGSRVETLEVGGGHIGMTVGRRAKETTHAALARFLGGAS